MKMNNFVISGRLAEKPMLRKFPGGAKVTEVRMCHNRFKKTGDGPATKVPDWYTLKCWGEQAEVLCTESSKGQVITVSGTLALETVHSETKGHEVIIPTINVQSFELGRMSSGHRGQSE